MVRENTGNSNRKDFWDIHQKRCEKVRELFDSLHRMIQERCPEADERCRETGELAIWLQKDLPRRNLENFCLIKLQLDLVKLSLRIDGINADSLRRYEETIDLHPKPEKYGEWRRVNIEHQYQIREAVGLIEQIYRHHLGELDLNADSDNVHDALTQAEEKATQEGAFNPNSIEDAREKTFGTIVRRRGRRAFRRALLEAYEGKCAITGRDVPAVLEAAHIHPYRGDETDHITNGLLLCSDVHTLFDLGLIGVDPENYAILVSAELSETIYGKFAGKTL